MNNVLSTSEVKTALIQKLHEQNEWNGEVRSKIANVINGYGKRDGLIDQISGVVYRIFNAIKALFGQSDWQVAKKSIIKCLENHTGIALMKSVGNVLGGQKQIEQEMKKILNPKSEALLQAYVKSTHFQASSAEELDQQLREQLVIQNEGHDRLQGFNIG